MGGKETKPAEPSPEFDRPWRTTDWEKKNNLQLRLENFKCCSNVKDIKILVIGQIGAGKSSFINSIQSAFKGTMSTRALANSSAGDSRSFTTIFKGFTIRNQEKSLPFVFKDIMGLEADALSGSLAEDIISAVFGNMKDGYKFNEKQALSHKDPDYNHEPTLSDKSFCVVYVMDANTAHYTDDKLIDKLKIIRQRISKEGIPQVIVMTKVDEACPLVKEDLKKIYTSKKIKEMMELCSAKVGVTMTNIFPVKNYHEEIRTDNDTDVLLLTALEHIANITKDRLEDIDQHV